MATYYISPSGNDSTGNGSSGNPWATLVKFLNNSISGDTCICKNGTYMQTGYYAILNRTIQAENNGLAIFDGGATYYGWGLSQNVDFNGLTFRNMLSGESFYPTFGYSNVTQTGAVTFTKCIFKNNYTDDNNNDLAGLFGTFANPGCIFNFDRCLIYGTQKRRAVGTNGHLIKTSGDLITVNIINCTIVSDTLGTYGIDGLVSTQSNARLTLAIKNSIIFNGSGKTFTISKRAPLSTALSHSCGYLLTGDWTGVGLITSNPLFVDVANANFDLRPTSPCIGSGTLI